jgi:RNA polymerase sigma-70 factor (ECF subfamily)
MVATSMHVSVARKRTMTSSPNWPVENYRPMLRLYVQHLQTDRRLQARFDASDLVHDALLKAHEHLPQFRGRTEAEFVCWLREIQNNVYRDRVAQETAKKRDVRRERAVNDAIRDSSACFERFVDRQLSPDRAAVQREQIAQIAAAIEQLPDNQRLVVMLWDFNNCSIAEIAKQMNCTEKAAAGLLYRARKRIRELVPKDSEAPLAARTSQRTSR